MKAQLLKITPFHLFSSFSSNVPSPAPNGQVPSPAPEDQNKVLAPDSAGIGGGSNTNNTTTTNTNKLGAPVSRNSKPALSQALSTIPEVSTHRELNNNNQLSTSSRYVWHLSNLFHSRKQTS